MKADFCIILHTATGATVLNIVLFITLCQLSYVQGIFSLNKYSCVVTVSIRRKVLKRQLINEILISADSFFSDSYISRINDHL